MENDEMKEEPKRFEPTKETVRHLFALSGNLCAYPNCVQFLIDEKGEFVGQICHIEGVKGERFNNEMSNEARRQSSNLMLMCYPHHKNTNDESIWTVKKMRELKNAHEAHFRHPEKAILAGLKDWTKVETLVVPRNLNALIQVLDLPLADEEAETYLSYVLEYIERFKGVPVEYRAFLGRVVQRMFDTEKMNLKLTRFGMQSAEIPAEDIRQAFKLSRGKLFDLCGGLDRYGLGSFSEGFEEAQVSIRHVYGTSFWYEVVEYCHNTKQSFNAYYEDLNFSGIEG